MGLAILVLVSVFATSLISGVLGMAGGMILMAVYSAVFTVTGAMVLHGLTQATANGYRAWLGRREIAWKPVTFQLIGTIAALAVFSIFLFVPNKATIYFGLGLLPFISYAKPLTKRLDVLDPRGSLLCGFVVTAIQLVAGVSGPLLDLFFLHSKLDRYQTIATKALLSTFGHCAKIGYFGYAAFSTSLELDIPWYLLPLIVYFSMWGTKVGRNVLEAIDDAKFRAWTRYCLLVIGIVFLGRGAVEIL